MKRVRTDVNNATAACLPVIPMDVLLTHVFPHAINHLGHAFNLMLVCRAVLRRARTTKEFWEPFLTKKKIAVAVSDYIMWPQHMMDNAESLLDVVRSKFYMLNHSNSVSGPEHWYYTERYTRRRDGAFVSITYWPYKRRLIEKHVERCDGPEFSEYVYLTTKTTVTQTSTNMLITSPALFPANNGGRMEVTSNDGWKTVSWHTPNNNYGNFVRIHFNALEGQLLLFATHNPPCNVFHLALNA
jgi:hypothetical protein